MSAVASAAAVAFLRRRTLLRAARAYVRWVGKAVGWWTVAYLVFWLVVFVASGVQLALVPAAEPLPAELAALASAALAAWLALPLRVTVPPVHLDRRDLVRLALAPVPPRAALGYRMWVGRGSAGLAGAALGGAWSLFAASFLHLSAPWAAVAVGALAAARVDLHWLRYAGPSQRVLPGASAGLAGALLSAVAALSALTPLLSLPLGGGPRWGLAVTGALAAPGALALAGPLALLACAHLAARRALAEAWPPRFAPQSFVLSQLRGLRSLELISQVAGLDAGGAYGVERERLLAALHDRPGALRPSRSLRTPAASAPVWLALAWRAASALYRRPRARWAGLALQALAAAAAGLAASGALARAAGSPGGVGTAVPGGAPGLQLGGPATVLVAGFLLAQVAAALLGPEPPPRLAPVPPAARTWGRLLPALAVMAVAVPAAGLILASVPAPGLAGLGAASVAGLFAVALTAALVLEKYSARTGVSPRRFEPQAVAAVVVALPALLLEAFGYPAWTLLAQWALLAAAAVVDV